jgi:hypothetical protein
LGTNYRNSAVRPELVVEWFEVFSLIPTISWAQIAAGR